MPREAEGYLEFHEEHVVRWPLLLSLAVVSACWSWTTVGSWIAAVDQPLPASAAVRLAASEFVAGVMLFVVFRTTQAWLEQRGRRLGKEPLRRND